jgi:hypothetical protein
MIMRLALLLDTSVNYIFYLDNLFMSILLVKAFKEVFIGITGITRKSSKGLFRWLDNLKRENRQLIWDFIVNVIENGILCFVW